MKAINLLEFPSNLGLTAPAPGKEPGVRNLPDWLRQYEFHQIINPESILRLDPPAYQFIKDPETGIRNADSIVDYAIKQADLIGKVLDEGKFPLTIGGDCSILIGAALALKQKGDYAVFYLDGHTDFMDLSFSTSGGAAGMVAAFVAGKGHEKITDILNLWPYIKEENLWCVGNREYDDAYEDEIRHSKATYKSLALLRKEGIANCVQAFLREVENKGLAGFWLHIDVDVLNDEVMPCVDSRTPDGLTYEEFNELTGYLLKSDQLTGLEITILDPDLDPTGAYTKTFVQNFTDTINDAFNQVVL